VITQSTSIITVTDSPEVGDGLRKDRPKAKARVARHRYRYGPPKKSSKGRK
jgi:hypothetical protein